MKIGSALSLFPSPVSIGQIEPAPCESVWTAERKHSRGGKPLRPPSQSFRQTVNAQAHIELGFTRMATTLPAGAAQPPVLDNPNRRVARLLRYLLSYLGQFLPAVLLMALVGL